MSTSAYIPGFDLEEIGYVAVKASNTLRGLEMLERERPLSSTIS